MEQQDRGMAPEAASAGQDKQLAKARLAADLKNLALKNKADVQSRDEQQLQKREERPEQPDIDAVRKQVMDRLEKEKAEKEAQRKREEAEKQRRQALEERQKARLAQMQAAQASRRQALYQQKLNGPEQQRLEQKAKAERQAKEAARQREEKLPLCKIICGLLLYFGFGQCLTVLLWGVVTLTDIDTAIASVVRSTGSMWFGLSLLIAGARLYNKLPEKDRFTGLRRLFPWLWRIPLYKIAIGMYLAGLALDVFNEGVSSIILAAFLLWLNFQLGKFLDIILSKWLLLEDKRN